MWWCEASTKRDVGSGDGRGPRSAAVRAVLAGLLVLPLLTACGDGGFRPMYGAAGVTAGVADRLAGVDFATIPGRVGQRVRNELIFGARGGAEAAPPTHRFEVAIRESVTSALVRKDGEALSQIYNLEASFRLVDIAGKRVVFEGQSQARAPFDRTLPIFANVRAREDAENRAARTIANEMKDRLAIFLSSSGRG
jgi:LPS-assembly lipoprotein